MQIIRLSDFTTFNIYVTRVWNHQTAMWRGLISTSFKHPDVKTVSLPNPVQGSAQQGKPMPFMANAIIIYKLKKDTPHRKLL